MCQDRKTYNAENAERLRNITKLFLDQGVDENDISFLIKTIRELGTENSLPTTMKDKDGNDFFPTLQEAIDFVSLSPRVKEDATVVLNVLKALVPKGSNLLYSIY